ncbi:hypothetical protein PoB_006253800 [Plakobranchus ocellatus]|uniref:Uncharacterized protein n=1 Tax=Plakobranchus ocellatus TaxID=259542 RepID=A0AAV4CVX0_9GAST|nr:hypothetical protein PoB_006253800 [Plakobranchus ocellatus]
MTRGKKSKTGPREFMNGTDAVHKSHKKVYERTDKGTREEKRGRGRSTRTEKDIRLFQKKARSLSSKKARSETQVSRNDPPTRRIKGFEDCR